MFLVYNQKSKTALRQGEAATESAVACLFDAFPRFTESVAYREVQQMESMGAQVALFSLQGPSGGPLPNEALVLIEKTTYLHELSFPRKAIIHLSRLLRRPGRYIGTLLHALFAGDSPFRILRHVCCFWRGVVVAHEAALLEITHFHIHHAAQAAEAGLVASRMLQIPFSIVVSSRDLQTVSGRTRKILQSAEFIVCRTQWEREKLLEIFPTIESRRVHVIPPGLDPDAFPYGRKVVEKMIRFRLVTIARLTADSGVRELIEACKILDARGVGFEAIIIGEGPERGEYQQICNRYHLNHRIRFPGARRMEEIVDILGRADLCVQPGPGMDASGARTGLTAMLEAMAMGVPIVTVDLPAVREIVNESVGRLLPEFEPAALADVVEELLEQAQVRQKLAAAARRRVREQFHIADAVSALLELIHRPAEEMNSREQP